MRSVITLLATVVVVGACTSTARLDQPPCRAARWSITTLTARIQAVDNMKAIKVITPSAPSASPVNVRDHLQLRVLST